MEIVEIRDLDGPNLFALYPVIKLEIIIDPDDPQPSDRMLQLTDDLSVQFGRDPLLNAESLIMALHGMLRLEPPDISHHALDIPHHHAICFSWEWRTAAVGIAQATWHLLSGEAPGDLEASLHAALDEDRRNDDRPTWVRDIERSARTIAITGTNGKTTTTRLLAHIARNAGYSTGWSSSSGVYINGELVLEGDYTGHGGARRVLVDPDVEIGVLETARGGILLRGIGFESNDVGVFLNVSADHLGLHGVTRIETLTRVKGTVVRTTRPQGVAVLNADDPLVLTQSNDVRAEIMLFSQDPFSPIIREHAENGGRYLVRESEAIHIGNGFDRREFVRLIDVPITFGGAARHMVENSLAASAAALALGIDESAVRDGLATFTPDPEHNAGRLNVFEMDGRSIVVDFAHNESGLRSLIEFAKHRFPDRISISAIIGTAGDRDDEVFRGLGRIAGELADRIILKKNPGYLRGRDAQEMIDLMLEGIRGSGAEHKLAGTYESEYLATFTELSTERDGDVLVIMCVEDFRKVIDRLQRMEQ